MQKDDLQRLVDYTVWANHRVVRAAATLTVDEFKRDLGSSHGGVRGTLAHMVGTEWIWLERFKGISPDRGPDEAEFPDILAVKERWGVIEAHRADWLASLREDQVSAVIAYKNLKGEPNAVPLWQIVQHMTNHATYHRGQVITLLRQLGARAVGTDMVTWDRERAAGADPGPPA
jgi:uncharacterized damage-inducible protein DinB